jgi:hypothetical protein
MISASVTYLAMDLIDDWSSSHIIAALHVLRGIFQHNDVFSRKAAEQLT